MRKMWLAAVTLAAAGLVLGATSASADAPDRYTWTENGYTETNTDCGFPMEHVIDLVATEQYFYDDAGEFREYRQTVRNLHSTFTNNLTGESVTSTGGLYMVTYVAGDDFVTFTGRVVIINQSGEGILMQDAGRVQLSGEESPYEILFGAGRHDLHYGTFGEICSYLG